MEKNNIVHPYIPNSVPATRKEMLAEVGVSNWEELFSVIPERLQLKEEMNLPEPMLDEYTVQRHTERLLRKNKNARDYLCFLGAGCAPHYVPAVVDEIVSRGEVLTSFAGSTMINHGVYQMIFEYQSQMAELLDMDLVGFPLFDGTIAAGHALRMANRINGRNKVIVPKSLNPETEDFIKNYLKGVTEDYAEIIGVNFDEQTGLIDLDHLKELMSEEISAILIENPNYFGQIETQAEAIGKLAKESGAEFIVYTDPISNGVIAPPAHYGANITIGDLHSLGLHMSAGGGVAGFMAFKEEEKYMNNFKEMMVTLVPTVAGEEYGFNLLNFEHSSYGAREEGNEFTGTGSNLSAVSAGVYLALMGPTGMEEIGNTIMKRSQYAQEKLSQLPGVKVQFESPFFKEFCVNFDETGKTVAEINKQLLDNEIFGGKDLSERFPELGQSGLFCVTEVHTKEDIDYMVKSLEKIISS